MLFAYTTIKALKTFQDIIVPPITGLFYGGLHYSAFMSILERLPRLSDDIHRIKLSISQLSTQSLDEINPEVIYQLGTSKNYILGAVHLPDALSIAHGSVAIRPIDATSEPWMLLGRQSPYFRNEDAPTDVTPVTTRIDNEAKYNLFKRTPYHISWDDTAVVTGAMLIKAIEETNKAICKAEVNTFIHSNCYTGALYLMTQLYALAEITRPDSLSGIASYIRDMADDHLGVGVTTSPLLSQTIMAIADRFISTEKKSENIRLNQ